MNPILPNTDSAWSNLVAKDTNKYFKKQYKDGPREIKQSYNGTIYTVYRPNHALAHGLRQGLLAADIAHTIATSTLKFASQDGKDLKAWVDRKVKEDANFLKKVEFAAAFQRTGRQSEVGSSDNPTKYNAYERQDAVNFNKDAKKYIGNLFKDQDEANIYKEAILWSTANEGKIDAVKCKDLYFLRKIFHTSHTLDLRRMTKFDKNRVKASAVEELFGAGTVDTTKWTVNAPFANEEKFMRQLWSRSGKYLAATGDRDVELMQKDSTRKTYSPIYCYLAHNPSEMVKALHKARAKNPIKL